MPKYLVTGGVGFMPKTRWSGLKKEMDVLETHIVRPKAKVISMAASS